MKYDFGGYVTKANIPCSDKRVIMVDAFEHQDGSRVPLVYQHNRNNPENVLGYVDLENRQDGVYGYGMFNNTERGQLSKELVQHGDVGCLSIFANDLTQKGNNVCHGRIIEVSLVLAGANPGAVIDNLMIEHADGSYETEDASAIICSGEDLDISEEGIEHAATDPKATKKTVTKTTVTKTEPADRKDDDEEDDEDMDDDRTLEDIYNSMTEEQKDFVKFMVGAALSEDRKGSDKVEQSAFDDEEDEEPDDSLEHADDTSDALEHSNESEDDTMKHNVFDDAKKAETLQHSLTSEQVSEIFADAKKCGSLKDSFLEHAATYGFDNIDILFPDAKSVTTDPRFLKRDSEWVDDVLRETTHVPFSRVKTVVADITADEARARGYVKGNKKKDEVINLLRRVTTPTTVYKKQKLDRDDILDITELDTIPWLKGEMRVMLNEELARAYLIGDGREADSEDKINEQNIRPIYKDDDMYAHHVVIEGNDAETLVEAAIRSRKNYKGSGTPTMYTTADNLTNMLLKTDKVGRRLYANEADLAAALRVRKIVEVPVMDGVKRTVEGKEQTLEAIIVNLRDYTVGADRGGEVSMFDDFDIDYNQYKYLIETRCSGALTMPKSAIVIESVAAATGASEEGLG